MSPDDAAFLASLAPDAPSRYHRLNPLTKAVFATVESLGAFLVGGYLGPLAIVALVIASAAVGGVARRLVRISLLLSLPIAISVVLVSVFTRAGTHVLFSIGPFDATTEGIDFTTSLRDARAIKSLGQVPLIVLTAGTFVNSKLIPDESRAALQERWEGLQKTFLTLSTNARQSFVRDSGHFVQRDNPGAIIQAIRTVI